MIRYRALKLRCIFDGDDAIIRGHFGHHIKDGIHKGGLAGAGCSDRQNVLFPSNCGADDLRVIEPAHIFDKAVPLTNVIQRVGLASKNSCLFVLGEREDFLWPQSNRENGPTHDGRNDTFEPAAIEREFGLKNRPLMVHYRTLPGCNGIQSTRRLGRRHESNVLKTLAHPFHPKRGIRIEDDIFGSLIVEQLEYRVSKFAPQFGFETAMLFIVREARNSS